MAPRKSFLTEFHVNQGLFPTFISVKAVKNEREFLNVETVFSNLELLDEVGDVLAVLSQQGLDAGELVVSELPLSRRIGQPEKKIYGKQK